VVNAAADGSAGPVRLKGDAALLDLAAKFDKVKLQSPVLLPPYPPELMVLSDDVRDAIDKAYSNIHKFYKAQATGGVLVAEIMPGWFVRGSLD